MIKLDDVKIALLVEYYHQLVNWNQDLFTSLDTILVGAQSSISKGLFRRSADELVKNGWLDEEAPDLLYGTETGYRITNKGIRRVESRLAEWQEIHKSIFPSSLFSISTEIEPDAWKAPDKSTNVSEEKLEEIRKTLQDCLKSIDAANLSQSDRADASQRIKAAQEVVEAPNPPWKSIADLIRPFSNSFLGELAKKLIGLLFGS